MKNLICLFILFFVLTGFSNCAHRIPGPDVKVYVSKPSEGGVKRKNEITPYPETENFRCLDKRDFDALLNYCLSPRQSKRKRKRFISNVNTFLQITSE